MYSHSIPHQFFIFIFLCRGTISPIFYLCPSDHSLFHPHPMTLPWSLKHSPESSPRECTVFLILGVPAHGKYYHPSIYTHRKERQSNGTYQMKDILLQPPRCQGMTVSMIVLQHSLWEAQSDVFHCIIKTAC